LQFICLNQKSFLVLHRTIRKNNMNELLILWILLIPTTAILTAYYFLIEHEPHNNALRDPSDRLQSK